jgi:hypothetical protein
MRDREAAERLQRLPLAVTQRRRRLGIPSWYYTRRWNEREIGWLGTMPDAEVARRMGCHCSTVQNRRLKLKIPAHQSPAAPRPWTRAELQLLGTAPDAEIARRLGCSLHRVRTQRQKLKIRFPSYARP